MHYLNNQTYEKLPYIQTQTYTLGFLKKKIEENFKWLKAL